MAYSRNYNKTSKKKSQYTNIEKFAFNMGCVARGLKNDTRAKDSYNKGLNGFSPKTKKPVC